MHLHDIARSALGGLWRQKARTVLTVLGVAVGTTALAFSLALGFGLRDFIENEFKSRSEFWNVQVYPKNFMKIDLSTVEIPADKIAVPENVPAARRERLQLRLKLDYQNSYGRRMEQLLTTEQIETLKSNPAIREVHAFNSMGGLAWFESKSQIASIYVGRFDIFGKSLENRLLFGRLPKPDAEDEILVSEFLLFKLGVVSDEQLEQTVADERRMLLELGNGNFGKGGSLAALLSPEGARAEITKAQRGLLDRIAKQLPQKIDQFDLSPAEKALVKLVMAAKPQLDPLKPISKEYDASGTFKVVGVVSLPEQTANDPTDLFSAPLVPREDVLLPARAGEPLMKKIPERATLGYPNATLLVVPGSDLESLVPQIEAEANVDTISGLKFYRSVRREVTLISAGLNLFAFISMIVACIGIANTLFTSVLERTKEIGIWKSLGARDGHILLLFLGEGMLIGVLGGIIGLVAAWLLSFPADTYVQHLIATQRGETLISKTVFSWPAWLPLAVIAFSATLTTLAALYPANRAARVHPVEALRHE